MVEKIKKVLKQQLEKISPSSEELEILNKKAKIFLSELKDNIKKAKIQAEIFIGGSFAKNTLIKKSKYDVDVFIRFSKDSKNISDLLAKAMPKNAIRIHGSRDYFSIKNPEDNLEFEIIPTIKINNPNKAENITDLSYFHVNYVLNKLKKNPKLAEEIRLAKAFAYYSNCYGAESYIHGFSGYAVELLIIHYKTFLNFLKTIVKVNPEKEKLILDSENLFKNKEAIYRELNEAKLKSPIVLIDPTFKERNAMAALSDETFYSFQKIASAFIKNPSEKFFELEDREKSFFKKYKDIIILEVLTNKQAGDIAGTKLKKFYEFFIKQSERFFDISSSEFIYDEKVNKGKILLSLKPKKEIIFPGPPVKMIENLRRFKLEHKKVEIKNGIAFAKEKSMTFKEFLGYFKSKNERILASMDITDIQEENKDKSILNM